MTMNAFWHIRNNEREAIVKAYLQRINRLSKIHCLHFSITNGKICEQSAGVSELADETDSKSVIRKGVWVRVPPPAISDGSFCSQHIPKNKIYSENKISGFFIYTFFRYPPL